MGREIKAIIFTIDSTLDSMDLDWRLIHPETNDKQERILLEGNIDSMTSGEPFKHLVKSGTLGYHEPLILRFLKQKNDAFSASARAVSEMLVSIEYENGLEEVMI